MASLITSYRCAKTFRSSSTSLFIIHLKNEKNVPVHKRCYHEYHKIKRTCWEIGYGSPFLQHRGHDQLTVRLSRFLSTSTDIKEKSSTNALNTETIANSPTSHSSPVLEGSQQQGHTLNISNAGSIGETAKTSDIPSEMIPEPPELPVTQIIDSVTEIAGEPTFASLGLGGNTPVGVIQSAMEFLHIGCSLPWWASIAIGTVVVRILIFPLVIIAQRNAAKMNNYLPQMQVLQMKMTEARQTGNQLDAARYAQEMVNFMKEKDLNPLKNMVVPLAQAPLFISFFLSLRKMAACPVESLKEGGLFWFTDLTVPDQYFILPIVTSATLWLTIEVGTDAAKLTSSNMHMMKYVLRAMPVIILPFTMNFPGAILCYWVCSNFISLGQVAILRIPTVRDYFKIEKLVTHSKDTLPMKQKGFVKGFKDSWQNMKITRELEERQRFDEVQFLKAGRGPIQKTFKNDPTKVSAASPPGPKPMKDKKT
ncbi:hypothetical protein J437_LFUL014875 [Ladona fulva]|uniref:Membrane insertase YidC/Oxa/ALB C-terminal domain-containing protein n=1 Tax=Ladona fulva TaxID=123851 RepID=A0A8K0KJC1_LADFU|nr:hypothetical protein J437_LFUL014875 [Ladona fulva]